MLQESMIDLMAFGRALNERRASMGDVSLTPIASAMGISKATLSKLERGGVPTLDTYIKACKWLGVPLDQFVKSD